MNLIQSILTANECYTAGRKIAVKGLMIHSVGCNQPSAMVFVKGWNTPQPNGRQVCVHAFLEASGNVYQCLPWDHRGWHCGSGLNGSGNNTHIGVEMTEPATIKYTGGASWTDNDPANTKAHVLATYKTAVELFTELAKQFKLDPLADGVIISHAEGYKRGIASNHGDPEHLWGKFGLSMAQFRQDVKAAMQTSAPAPDTSGYTSIAGTAKATAGQLRAYVAKLNPDAPDLADLYISEGEREGIRGDVAFAQSCLETGNFKFGGDVKPAQNNYAGIGATGGGVAGNSFKTPQEGIQAQIQHLKAYANAEPLNGELVDPRFAYVARGAAPYVEWLGIPDNPQGKGWAAGANYGAKILNILAAIMATAAPVPAPAPEPTTPAAKDNEPHEWERVAVEKALSRHIIQGDASGNLLLHTAATRADVLVFLERAGVL